MKRYPVAPGRPGRGAGSVGHRVWRFAIGTLLFALPFVLLPVDASLASSAPHVTPDDGPDTSTCAMCHRAHTAFGVVSRQQPGSWESTGSALVLSQPSDTGDQVLCLTCHGIDRTGSTIDVQSDVMRASVHSMTPEPSDYGPVDKQCSSCHDAHGSARDPETGLPYASLLRSSSSTGTVYYRAEEYCATCHFDPRDEESNRFDGLAVYRLTAHSAGLADNAPATGITCSICHIAHGSDFAPLIRDAVVPSGAATTPVDIGGNDRSLCYVCHEVAHVTYDGSETYETSIHALSEIAVGIVAEWPRSEEATRLAGECQNCHNPMGADDGQDGVVPSLLTAEGSSLCYGCHNEELAAETASEETSTVVDMASAAVMPYGEDSEFEEGAELVVSWDPENEPLSYSALHVHTQQREVEPPRGLEGPRRYLSGARSGSLAFGDIDGLGFTELVVANPARADLTVLRYDPLAGLASEIYSIEETATFVAVGQFTGTSGADEVAALSVTDSGESTLRVYRMQPNGGGASFEKVGNADYDVGWYATGLAVGDLGLGGGTDIVVTALGRSAEETNTPGAVFVLSHSAGEVLDSDSFETVLAGPRGPSVGPVRSGGSPGIVVANSVEETPSVSVYSPDGVSHSAHDVFDAPGGLAWDTVVGEFMPLSGGSRLGVGVAVRNDSGSSSSAVSVLRAGGTGLGLPVHIETGQRYASSALAVGDLDGDGVDQLVVANAGTLSRTAGESSVSPSVQILVENAAGTALEIGEPRWAGGTEMSGSTPAIVAVDMGTVGRSRHPVNAVPSEGEAEEEIALRRFMGCPDCHNVHAMEETTTVAPDAYGPITGATGVDLGTDPLETKDRIEFEYELCLRCHAAGYDGFPAPDRDILGEFESGSAHPVLAPSASPGSEQIYCVDCHGNAEASDPDPEPAGPHTSTSAPLLSLQLFGVRPTEEAMLCYSCHDYGVLHDGDQGSDFRDSVLGPLHPLHIADFGLACQACHTTHGSENSHLVRADIGWVESPDGGACSTACHAAPGGYAYNR